VHQPQVMSPSSITQPGETPDQTLDRLLREHLAAQQVVPAAPMSWSSSTPALAAPGATVPLTPGAAAQQQLWPALQALAPTAAEPSGWQTLALPWVPERGALPRIDPLPLPGPVPALTQLGKRLRSRLRCLRRSRRRLCLGCRSRSRSRPRLQRLPPAQSCRGFQDSLRVLARSSRQRLHLRAAIPAW
jgi:hypothetical protein